MLSYKKPFLHSLGGVVNLSKIIKEEAPGSEDLTKVKSDITALQTLTDEHTLTLDALFAQDGILNDAIDALDTRVGSAETSLTTIGSSIANHEGRIVALEGTPPGETSVNGATGAVVLVGQSGVEVAPDGQDIFIRLSTDTLADIAQLKADVLDNHNTIKDVKDRLKVVEDDIKAIWDILQQYVNPP